MTATGYTRYEGSYARRRTARKRYRCGNCGGPILPGERYTEWISAPWTPYGPPDHWTRDRVCSGSRCRHMGPSDG